MTALEKHLEELKQEKEAWESLPERITEKKKLLVLLKKQFSSLPATTAEDVEEARVEKNSLPHDTHEFRSAVKNLVKKQKEAKAYRDKESDIEAVTGELEALERKLEDGRNLPVRISEVERCISLSLTGPDFRDIMKTVSEKCRKRYEKSGSYYFCVGCSKYRNGKCRIREEWGAPPLNWHIKEMEKAVEGL